MRSDLMRAQSNDSPSIEANLAGIGLLDAGDEIDKGRFARAIGPDEAADFARRDRNAHPIIGNEPAVTFAHIAGDEEVAHHASRARSPNSPVGRRSRTSSTSKKPYTF